MCNLLLGHTGSEAVTARGVCEVILSDNLFQMQKLQTRTIHCLAQCTKSVVGNVGTGPSPGFAPLFLAKTSTLLDPPLQRNKASDGEKQTHLVGSCSHGHSVSLVDLDPASSSI